MSPTEEILRDAESVRWELGPRFQDEVAARVSEEASHLASRHMHRRGMDHDCVGSAGWTGF